MIYIGCHLSVTNGYEAMGRQMIDFGGSTFAWFTRNPRGGKAKDIEQPDVEKLQARIDKLYNTPINMDVVDMLNIELQYQVMVHQFDYLQS